MPIMLWICQVDVGKVGASPDRHRRPECPCGRSGPRCPARIPPPRRRQDHQGQAARRGIQRYALLPRGAGAHHPRFPLRYRGRHLHPAGRLRRRRGHPVPPSASMIPSWNLRSPPTVPTACPSLVWHGKPPPPSACRCICIPPWYKGAGGDVNDLLKVRVENTELCQRYMAAGRHAMSR